jgi:sterol 14-demethylase
MVSDDTKGREPPRVSGGDGEYAHLDEYRRDPIGLMARTRAECGDVGEFTFGERDVVLLTGPDANEFYFRAPEEQLDQAEAYPFMTPIFGQGVVFDAPPERRREMLHNQALRDKFMRGHAATIATEVEGMVAGWDDEGEIDLLEWFAELTIYTSSACLIGVRFRGELDGSFARLYHELERGTDPIAYIDPYAPIESFRRRDAARAALVELVQGIMERRAAGPPPGDGEQDLLDVLMSIKQEDGSDRFGADIITGMFISMMFAGHHTTSGTAAWTLIELLRHGDELAAVNDELDELYADGSEVSFAALRSRRCCACTRLSSCCCGWPWKTSRTGAFTLRRERWSAPAPPSATGSRRTSPIPTPSSRPATSRAARRTGPIRGHGSPSGRDATAAWGPTSP